MVREQRAYSLLELLVTIGIIGIVALLAYPMIRSILQSFESRRAESMFENALRMAKVESFTSKKDVMICTLNTEGLCDRAGNGTLVVFYDQNRNNEKDEDEKLLYQQDWGLKYGHILLRVSASRHYIVYKGDTAKPRGHFGHLIYCSQSNNKRLSFKKIVNAHGKVRVERADLIDVGC